MRIQLLAAHDAPSSSAPRKLLLVIEDDPLLRESLMELLKLNGYRTVAAGDGQTGIDLAQSLQPDCILLDLRLPDMDGFTVLKRMKTDARTTPIPVIVLSGFSRSEDQELALKLEAAAYVLKPYNIDDLVATIQRSMS